MRRPMRFSNSLAPLVALVLLAFASTAYSASLGELQAGWVEAKYHTPNKAAQEKKLNALVAAAATLGDDAEARVWHAVVLATRAKLIGGSSALDDVRAAKNLLEAALPAAPPSVKDGYADALLGALYGKVPGWPISFGDTGKAKKHFANALARGPGNIDVLFLHGEFLAAQGHPAEARAAFEKVLDATPRHGRETADEGRQAEAEHALATLQ